MAHTDVPFAVRDRRRAHFFTIDNKILDEYGEHLGPYGLAVYMVLCRFANSESTCWPSLQTVADRAGMSRRQVIRKIKSLTELGLIAIISQQDEETGEHRANFYVLLDTSDSQSPPPSDSQSPPGDSQSLPPNDSQSPPSDSQSPKQNTTNNTYVLEEYTNNNGRGGLSIPEDILEKFVAITGEELTKKDRQYLTELALYPQGVVDDSFAALRTWITDPGKEPIRNKAAWLVGTARRKAEAEDERIRRVKEANKTLNSRKRYEVSEEYRDIVVGCH